MTRFPKFPILALMLAAMAWAQEPDDEPVGDEESPADILQQAIEESIEGPVEETVEETVEVPEEFDEAGLDEQGFTDADDDFRPSEDIPADQSIPFPSDI